MMRTVVIMLAIVWWANDGYAQRYVPPSQSLRTSRYNQMRMHQYRNALNRVSRQLGGSKQHEVEQKKDPLIRVFYDRSGLFYIEAKLVKVQHSNAVLLRSIDHKKVSIPLSRFKVEDRKWIVSTGKKMR